MQHIIIKKLHFNIHVFNDVFDNCRISSRHDIAKKKLLRIGVKHQSSNQTYSMIKFIMLEVDIPKRT